jgi:hypothetical protein
MKKRKACQEEYHSKKRIARPKIMYLFLKIAAYYRGHIERCEHARRVYHFYS